MVLLLSHFQAILCCKTAEEVTLLLFSNVKALKIKMNEALDYITLSSLSVEVSRSRNGGSRELTEILGSSTSC